MEDKVFAYADINGNIIHVKDPIVSGAPDYIKEHYIGPMYWKPDTFISDNTKRKCCVLEIPRKWDIKGKVVNYTALMRRIKDGDLMKKIGNEIIEPIAVSDNRVFVEAL